MLQAGALDGELVAELGELLRRAPERHRVVLGLPEVARIDDGREKRHSTHRRHAGRRALRDHRRRAAAALVARATPTPPDREAARRHRRPPTPAGEAMRRHDEANPDDLEMSLPFHTLVAASLQRRGKILSEVRRASRRRRRRRRRARRRRASGGGACGWWCLRAAAAGAGAGRRGSAWARRRPAARLPACSERSVVRSRSPSLRDRALSSR